ncbi:Hpt domain-containing protein [Paracoccus salsus]|uniref:Hpt domain-containing protein n=1 Tax=Paracoccus salsus TaxID=2911061 RepID=UPI001F28CD76|nr:Hpt domain-containing protein [Paracoccus salsus]
MMIEWEHVLKLRDDIGSGAFASVVEMFLDEVEAVLMRLDVSDADQLCRDMHLLKGCALNLGFSEFVRLCAIGESRAATGHASQADLDAVLSCYSRSKQLFLRDLPHVAGVDPLGGLGVA